MSYTQHSLKAGENRGVIWNQCFFFFFFCCLVFFVVGSLKDEPGRPVSE